MTTRTRQEIFSIIYEHARTNPVKSSGPVSNCSVDKCLYRGPEGTKCFVGVLIPDDKYDPAFEMNGVFDYTVGDRYPILDAAGVDRSDADFAIGLQQVHDDYDPSRWLEVLQEIADEYGLEVPTLAQAGEQK